MPPMQVGHKSKIRQGLLCLLLWVNDLFICQEPGCVNPLVNPPVPSEFKDVAGKGTYATLVQVCVVWDKDGGQVVERARLPAVRWSLTTFTTSCVTTFTTSWVTTFTTSCVTTFTTSWVSRHLLVPWFAGRRRRG